MPAVLLPDIQAPVRAPIRGGILDAATVSDSPSLGFLRQGGGYESWACSLTMIPKMGADCVFTPAADKAFTAGPSFSAPHPFVVYATGACRSVGIAWEDIDAKVRDAYLMRESYAVEMALLDLMAPLATAVGGTASGIVVAIGELEQYAADHYAGAATLHIPTYFASQLCREQIIHKEGDVWHTCLGSKVSLGGGYGTNNFQHVGPGAALPGAGSAWVWATGEVTIDRGDLNVAKTIDTKTNNLSVLSERAYIASWDCMVVATQATLVPAGLAATITVTGGGG